MAIRKRPGKRKTAWVVDYYDAAGRRRWKTFKTYREARGGEAEILRRIRRGEGVAPSRVTFGELAEGFIERKGVKPSTARAWRAVMERHLLPAFGKVPVQRITRAGVKEFLEDLRRQPDGRARHNEKEGLSRNTARNVLTLLRLILAEGVERGLLLVNPCAGVKVPKAERDHVPPQNGNREGEELPAHLYSPLSEAEALRFAEKALALYPPPSPYGALFVAALYTGLRRGELMGLRWGDLELESERPALRVVWAYDREAGFVRPKSKAAIREVPLPAIAVHALREWRVASSHKRPEERVFPLDIDGHKRSFKRVLREAGLRPIRFHDLRATYASVLANRGLPPKVLQRLLGHSHFAVTMDIYARFTRDDGPELARAFTSFGATGSKMVAKQQKGAAGIAATP